MSDPISRAEAQAYIARIADSVEQYSKVEGFPSNADFLRGLRHAIKLLEAVPSLEDAA